MAGRLDSKDWMICGNNPRMNSPIIPSPSMIPGNQPSRSSQPVYSSAMLSTAIERKELISKPIMPTPNHKALLSDTRESPSHKANRAGKPANRGKAPVESDARINPVLAIGTVRKMPRTELKSHGFDMLFDNI